MQNDTHRVKLNYNVYFLCGLLLPRYSCRLHRINYDRTTVKKVLDYLRNRQGQIFGAVEAYRASTAPRFALADLVDNLELFLT